MPAHPEKHHASTLLSFVWVFVCFEYHWPANRTRINHWDSACSATQRSGGTPERTKVRWHTDRLGFHNQCSPVLHWHFIYLCVHMCVCDLPLDTVSLVWCIWLPVVLRVYARVFVMCETVTSILSKQWRFQRGGHTSQHLLCFTVPKGNTQSQAGRLKSGHLHST